MEKQNSIFLTKSTSDNTVNKNSLVKTKTFKSCNYLYRNRNIILFCIMAKHIKEQQTCLNHLIYKKRPVVLSSYHPFYVYMYVKYQRILY